jgi:hypothetical protein
MQTDAGTASLANGKTSSDLSGHRQANVLLCVVLGALLLAAGALALGRALHIPTMHLDGAYQTASGLFRLHAGDLPGRDFFPYLGVGVLYLIYPLFELAGAHLAASVFVAQFAVWIACAWSVALVWRLVWNGSSFLVALVCGASLTYALAALAFNPDILDLQFVLLSVNEFILLYSAVWMFSVVTIGLLWPTVRPFAILLAGSALFLFCSICYATTGIQEATFLLVFPGLVWFRFCWPAKWVWRSLAAAMVMTLVLIGLVDIARETNIVQWALTPGYSLRPLRAWLPYFAAFWMIVILGKSRNSRRLSVLAGALNGSLLLWSNDFAWSTAMLTAACFAFVGYRSRTIDAVNVTIYAVAGLLTATLLFVAACGGHPLSMLEYNFLDVARDQWWYFASWDERYRIFSPGDVVKLAAPRNVMAILVLIAVAVHAIRKRSPATALLFWVGLALAAGGVVASVGGHLGSYFAGLHFWAYTISVVAFLRLFWEGSLRFAVRRPRPDAASGLSVGSRGILLAASFAILGNAYFGLGAARQYAAASADHFLVPELGGYLKSSWKPYVETARKLSGSVVFEEYWGVLSAIQKRTPDWPVDAVIHALGSKRELLASKVFSQADTVVTTRSSYSSVWQPWLVSENYWLYSRLFREFDIVDMGPHTVIWRRGATNVFEPLDCRIAEQGAGVVVIARKTGYAEIEVTYRVDDDPKRKLVMLRNNINIVGGMRGYFSIDPSKTSLVFPAFLKEKGPQALDFRVVPRRTTAMVRATSCKARQIGRAIPEVLDAIPKSMEGCTSKLVALDPETLWPWEPKKAILNVSSTGACDG